MRILHLLALAAGLIGFAANPAAATDLKVMSFNIWGGGMNEQKPIDETIAVIKAVNPDIIGVQETRLEADPCTADSCPPSGESVAVKLAEALGYHVLDQSATSPALWANAILSRYPIKAPTTNQLGAEIDVDGRKVYAFNIHLDDSPYQPYQLLGIEYGDAPFIKTEAEAVEFATKTRGPALDLLEKDLAEAADAEAVFLFGDFNEPSHRDWTEAAAKAGRHPIKVAYPTALRIESLGFVDLFRAVFPDEVAKPAFTWTPTSDPAAKDDHHDRIDFAFGRSAKLEVVAAGIVGEKSPEADVVVTPWPSDHRAVYATVRF